jgi:hypothetical protein
MARRGKLDKKEVGRAVFGAVVSGVVLVASRVEESASGVNVGQKGWIPLVVVAFLAHTIKELLSNNEPAKGESDANHSSDDS